MVEVRIHTLSVDEDVELIAGLVCAELFEGNNSHWSGWEVEGMGLWRGEGGR